jgi:hypothetical protein
MLVSTRLVKLIENNADTLTKRWIHLVRSHPGTPTYHTYDEKELYDRAFKVYSQLGRWLSKDTSREEIAKQYTAMGAKRRKEGFQISEVIQALTITRRVLWFKVLDDGFLDTALDFRMAIDLSNQVVVYFDRAIYFAAVGYERGELASPESLALPSGAKGR